jgi:Tfp pilus assembly PilM family ATPase
LNELSDNLPGYSSVFAGGVYTNTATKEITALFDGHWFDFPKPTEIIKQLISQVAGPDDVIALKEHIPCQAGSGVAVEGFVQAVAAHAFNAADFIDHFLDGDVDLYGAQECFFAYAFLLDIGFMASTVSVVYGNGIVREESFDCGLGGILVRIMEQLGVDYERAERILQSANITGGYIAGDRLWVDEESGESYPEAKINDIIKCGLDELCERVQNFFAKHYREKAGFMSNPLSLTGEGLVAIAGASEHISKRLSRITQVVAPELPYYDKPNFSSRISVLAAALGKVKKKGLFARIFGGKKK